MSVLCSVNYLSSQWSGLVQCFCQRTSRHPACPNIPHMRIVTLPQEHLINVSCTWLHPCLLRTPSFRFQATNQRRKSLTATHIVRFVYRTASACKCLDTYTLYALRKYQAPHACFSSLCGWAPYTHVGVETVNWAPYCAHTTMHTVQTQHSNRTKQQQYRAEPRCLKLKQQSPL